MRIGISNKPAPSTKATIAISFIYNRQLSKLSDGQSLFAHLNKYDFLPERYAALATLRKKKSITTFKEWNEILPTIWLPFYAKVEDIWILDQIDIDRRSAPKYWGRIRRDWVRNPNDQNKPVFHSDIGLHIEADSLKKNELKTKLKGLVNNLITYSQLDFARVQYYSAEEVYSGMRGEEPDTILGARQLSEECLPDLYNISVWGKPYIDFFGRDRLLSAPCHKVEELPSGLIWMQLTPDVCDEKGRWTAIKNSREKVKTHLNNDAFFDPERHQKQISIQDLEKDPVLHEKFLSGELMKEKFKIYKVPKFDLSDIRKPLKTK